MNINSKENKTINKAYKYGKVPETYELLNVIDYLEEENEELKNIIKEALIYIDDNTYYKTHKGHINIDDLYIILQKGENNNK